MADKQYNNSNPVEVAVHVSDASGALTSEALSGLQRFEDFGKKVFAVSEEEVSEEPRA